MNNRKLAECLSKLDKGVIYDSYKTETALIGMAGVTEISERMESLMFPSLYPLPGETGADRERVISELFLFLKESLSFSCDVGSERSMTELAEEILLSLPAVKEKLIKDAIAIYKGDPAARSVYEIILCYPGFFAIMSYRLARLFYIRGIPYLPRMMTERAHRMTGIDIHPGAKIGESFCIDHGTGVVIGETATIGDRVKIYQGVTIGAKSFESDSDGGLIKGKKRHPDIGDDCIIYAGATILGGDTVIGNGAIIGGNVWLTHSVPAGERVYFNEK